MPGQLDQIMGMLGSGPQQPRPGQIQGQGMQGYGLQRGEQEAEMYSFARWIDGLGIRRDQLQPDQLMSYYQMWKQMNMQQQELRQSAMGRQ